MIRVCTDTQLSRQEPPLEGEMFRDCGEQGSDLSPLILSCLIQQTKDDSSTFQSGCLWFGLNARQRLG